MTNPKVPTDADDPEQSRRFIETATELGEQDDSARILDRAVVTVAKGAKKTPKNGSPKP